MNKAALADFGIGNLKRELTMLGGDTSYGGAGLQDELAEAGRETMTGKMATALFGTVKGAHEESLLDEFDDEPSFVGMPPRIVKQTKIVNRIHTVRKFDMDHFRVVKKMCEEFMAAGKEEYRKQQQNWNELY